MLALFAVGGASLVAVGAALAWQLGPAEAPSSPVDEPAAREPATPPATATPLPSGEQEWRLLAGGDVLMDLSELLGIDPFAGVQPPLSSADLALVNVEMSIATGGTPEPKEFAFRAPPQAARKMGAAGIDVATLGNNHSLDFGVGALFETIANLRTSGVTPVGGGANETEAYAPATFEMAGIRVALIGASRVFPRTSWRAGDGPGLASAYDEPRLLRAVREARASHDVVIVMVHWGRELAACPNETQVGLGEALLAAGATVVLGSHPHVLQPIVSDGRGVIAYSLGNFVWHPRRGPTGETGVLEVRFQGARVTGHTLHPHVLDRAGAPVPADTETAAKVSEQVSRFCIEVEPTPTPTATATP